MVSACDTRRETTSGLLGGFAIRRHASAISNGPFVVVRVLIGSLLLVAAGLKVHGLSRPIFDSSFLSSPRVQMAAVVAEIALGCLLLSGRFARLAWLLAISFFVLVGGVSLYVALTGQRSCPACFGAIRVPSWATCGLDAGIVAVLAFCRPRRGDGFSWRGAMSVAAGTAVACGAFFALTSAALASLRGERVSATPAISDVGDGRVGERRTFEIRLTNHARAPINIFGGAKSCGCDPTTDLPMVLASRARSASRWASLEPAEVSSMRCGFSPTIRHNPSLPRASAGGS